MMVDFIEYDKAWVKISLDFIEAEIRGRKAEEVVLIDEAMFRNSRLVPILIANESVSVAVPSYLDHFIVKFLPGRQTSGTLPR